MEVVKDVFTVFVTIELVSLWIYYIFTRTNKIGNLENILYFKKVMIKSAVFLIKIFIKATLDSKNKIQYSWLL